jgi:hypothetical protein
LDASPLILLVIKSLICPVMVSRRTIFTPYSSDVPASHKQSPCNEDRPDLRRDPMEPIDRRAQSADVRIKRFVHGYLCFT